LGLLGCASASVASLCTIEHLAEGGAALRTIEAGRTPLLFDPAHRAPVTAV